MGHKVAGCLDLGKSKSNEKPKFKEVPAVNIASVEPFQLPVDHWEIDTREEGAQSDSPVCWTPGQRSQWPG
jgi:hypothetical protein